MAVAPRLFSSKQFRTRTDNPAFVNSPLPRPVQSLPAGPGKIAPEPEARQNRTSGQIAKNNINQGELKRRE
jgi:hypothetical protein